MRPVIVQFLKHPDILHWGFEAVWLGEDEWGDWVALPQGSRRWKGEQEMGLTRRAAVLCAPRDAWWHLHFEGSAGDTYTHFVDIVTPAEWVTPNRYEMVDLDLDVALRHDGTVEVQDEDEFEAHQVLYRYSPEMIAQARSETSRVVGELEGRREPFFHVASGWLAKLEG